MADRDKIWSAVADRLGDRQLVWFGTRGDDAESVVDLPQFSGAISMVGRYRRRSLPYTFALEDFTNIRVDLDTFDIDQSLESDLDAFRAELLRVLARPTTLFTYRPTMFLTAAHLVRDRSRYLGPMVNQQAAFEFKPWVEQEVAELGVPSVPWRHIADREQFRTLDLLRNGPVVLRRSRSTGGVGLTRLDSPERLAELWPDQAEAFGSVAPLLEDSVPLNVGAVVWPDAVTVHHASVQLVGLPSCTRRTFGYCGNDFGAARELDRSILDAMERSVRTIGTWLRRQAYLGAFGVDFLLHRGEPLFLEVNPRFQGSTHASAQLSLEADRSCLLLDHLGALLGVAAPKEQSLADLMAETPDLSHVVVHNASAAPKVIDPSSLVEQMRNLPGFARADVLTRRDLLTSPDAVVARVTTRTRLSSSGFDLDERWRRAIDECTRVRSTETTAPDERDHV